MRQVGQSCRNYKKKKFKKISSEKCKVACQSLDFHHISVNSMCLTEGDRLKILHSYLLGVQWLLPKKNIRKVLSLWNNLQKKKKKETTKGDIIEHMVWINYMIHAWLRTSRDADEHLRAMVGRYTLSWRYLHCIWVRFVSEKDVTWKWYYFMEQTKKSLKNCIQPNA